ncbi:hypothetical protein [Acaryochloris sp. IP29b_bin.137]|nr:hypothetical protein [Acaryochloris sp. IP29b_bin.137]
MSNPQDLDKRFPFWPMAQPPRKVLAKAKPFYLSQVTSGDSL